MRWIQGGNEGGEVTGQFNLEADGKGLHQRLACRVEEVTGG
jgi:hypothetical protein